MKTENLYEHQQVAVDLIRGSIRSGRRRPMLHLPTGGGKTVVAAKIAQGARAKGNPLIFTVPAISLIGQTVEAFAAEGITDVGVIQADHELTDASAPIQIASVQSLMKRQIPMAGVVIVDEAHKWFSFYGEWMAMPSWRNVPFIGLSATPWTKGLGKHYDDLLIPTTTKDLIAIGRLAPFRIFAPADPDLSKVKTVAGDYKQDDLSAAMQEGPLTADIVTTWLEQWGKDKTLVFAVDRAHAQRIQEQFAGAGIACGYCDAFTSRDERREIGLLFHEGHLRVVVSIGTLTTGVDWDVRCIVLARPTKSEMLFCQIVGRGLRTAPGKADCLILDHSSTTKRLGFPDDIHHETLSGADYEPTAAAPATKDEPLPKACPGCKYLMQPKTRQCPACGFLAKPQTEIKTNDGELREMKRPAYTSADKARWWQEIRVIQIARGKSAGWASHRFKDKFGVWPNAYKDLPPAPFASPEVVGWVTAANIAFAKRRQAA